MPYALMQRRLEIPDLEALRRAFRGVGGMAPSDAPHIARDAFGILVKQMEHADAVALQQSLAREGVDTEIVDQSELGELPQSKRVRRVAVREEGLVVCDPYDRELQVPWDSFRVVSGGLVLTTEIQRTPAAGGLDWDVGDWGAVVAGPGMIPVPMRTGVLTGAGSLGSSRERQVWAWTADLILAGGTLRFVLSPDRLQFLDRDRTTGRDAETEFLEFLREVATRSGRATLNRVAFALREGETETLSYPSRNAYQEELLWLLWRLRQAGRLD